MKIKLIHDLVSIKDIADTIGTSPQNIYSNYLDNPNGRNKTKMLKAIVYGTYMMKEKLTPRDIKLARKLALALKDKDAE
jgi:hypothetical protein